MFFILDPVDMKSLLIAVCLLFPNLDVVVDAQKVVVLAICKELNLNCYPCSDCYPGGWCIKEPKLEPKCFCAYGWTGPKAAYIPSNSNSVAAQNRIRADNCRQPCHYTHSYRNGSCVEEKIQNANQCDIRCNRKTGVCINKRCRCTRGWIGPNAVYNRSLDTYVADYCDQECPYIGFGRENPGCTKKLREIPTCSLLCGRNDGICLQRTGQCLCPLAWTGPRAEYGTGAYEGRILADHCNVYCPYTDTRRNDFCVRHDYIERLQYAGHIAG